MAHPLPARSDVLLRSKKREAEDETQDEPLPRASDLISRGDIFPEDGIEVDEGTDDQDERRGFSLLAAVPGPLIAAAAFVPTFLAIFLGLSYLVGGVLQTGSTATAPVPPAAALMAEGTQGTPPPISESLRDPFVVPRVFDAPSTKAGDPRDVARPTDPREPSRAPSVAEIRIPTPAIESAGPTLPPAQPRTALIPAPESRPGRAPELPRQPQAAVLNTTPGRSTVAENRPAADDRRVAREWTPAAAFADREAANRLASSIQQQGYPVEIRQESSSSRPWVVWIGAQPRAGERRR